MRLVSMLTSMLSLLVLSQARENPEKKAILVAGDIVLGGLFPIHEKDGSSCGTKIYNRGVQRLEAMLFAVDKINADSKILPNITLGVHILDTCGRDTYALEQSLHFVRASLSFDLNVLECDDKSSPRLKDYVHAGPIFGVVGGSYSSVSLQVANLLRLFHIPQISPASTATALSDKTRFDYFARTVPPDNFQSMALVDVVKSVNWSYVSTVYSEGSYGESGIQHFTSEATNRNVCIAAAEKVPSTANETTFDNIIQKLAKKQNARSVVLFTRAEDARRILQAANKANLSQPFQWIASDGWGRQTKLVEDYEEEAVGAITVELQSRNIPGFDDYMASLTPENNTRNPWFGEYWKDVFGCVPEGMERPADARICDPKLKLVKERGYEQESKVQFVVDAVYAFALALHKLQREACGEGKGLCANMSNYDKGDFYQHYLLNVSFKDLADSEVQFDKQGDGLARYEILNYQRKSPDSKEYHYKEVGQWHNSKLVELDTSSLVWSRDEKEPPISACSLPCTAGMIKKQQGDTCCWVCDRCEEYEYVYNETTCMDCGNGSWPHPDKKGCYQLPIKHIRWTSMYAIVPAVVACLGIVLTLTVSGLMFHSRDTPVVKASGREVSFIMLTGVLVCYLNTFLLLAKPSLVTCILQRFGVGVSFSATYGALLTKTNRISRIFTTTSAVRPKYISPTSQVCISVALIAFQVVLTLVWMIIEPPGTRYLYPDRQQVILKCNIQNMSFFISQLYNAILIMISTIFAFKTRKIPANFNESKYIGFTMYTTCIIWLAFVPIYYGTGNAHETQITTLCVSISLSATVILVCLYGPKVNIILFHPKKNQRSKVTIGTFKMQSSSAGTSSINKCPEVPSGENLPLQSAFTAAVQTSVGVTEISITSNTSNKTNNEQVAQL